MLYQFFEKSLPTALNNEIYQKRFEDILMSIVMTNNLASRRRAWLIKEARITENSVDSFTIRLQREHQFLQCVIDSFIPFELKKNPLEELLKSATETRGHVNALLTALESERESSGMGKEELESNQKQSNISLTYHFIEKLVQSTMRRSLFSNSNFDFLSF
nr:hypothetical transcript [Hymenolepis microstoma]